MRRRRRNVRLNTVIIQGFPINYRIFIVRVEVIDQVLERTRIPHPEPFIKLGNRTAQLRLPNWLLRATVADVVSRYLLVQALTAGMTISWGCVDVVFETSGVVSASAGAINPNT